MADFNLLAGHGCLGCLSNSDWLVRKRAAETLLSLVRYLGPQIENGSSDRQRVQRCLAYLKDVKTDKVKPTRDALSQCVAAYEQLASWMAQNPVRKPCHCTVWVLA